jgi:hypothetical protein
MQQYLLLRRNLVYTGITRGKKLVVLIGQRKALAIAVRNNKTEQGFSGLLYRLQTPRDEGTTKNTLSSINTKFFERLISDQQFHLPAD